MKHLSLAAKYRPQTFAQVAGQDMVKAVLSRAAAEDRVAAAYLLSGTRGVGKTTIARIFAKALNCRHAPGPEPCNQCDQCRKITQGSHVDVTEIDGASNNSVEDARALRENIGYAPMEGRYKVFIIDEAHMLSRSAFNALLKTLEEPPARVVFIFATTEAHKFPVTIISRCQHFVFRHLGEDALVQHLSQVLNRENVPFEEGAVRLIARRAAGSVRDSMSLLDQTLALGGDHLTSAVAREVLGLAGQELFADLFDALHARDCAAVSQLCAGLFRQGVDIGFFVRELAGHLRDLFLLRQGGEAVAPSLGLPGEELLFWQGLAPRFSAGHLHAAWQMVLDAQRGIVQNPEPAAALELLLLNLALLPQLLPLERMDSLPAPAAPVQGHPGHDRQDGSAPPPRDMDHAAPLRAPAARSRARALPEPRKWRAAPAGDARPPERGPSRTGGGSRRPGSRPAPGPGTCGPQRNGHDRSGRHPGRRTGDARGTRPVRGPGRSCGPARTGDGSRADRCPGPGGTSGSPRGCGRLPARLAGLLRFLRPAAGKRRGRAPAPSAAPAARQLGAGLPAPDPAGRDPAAPDREAAAPAGTGPGGLGSRASAPGIRGPAPGPYRSGTDRGIQEQARDAGLPPSARRHYRTLHRIQPRRYPCVT